VPITHVTKLLAVDDAKIAKLTADSGTAPTYGALIDIPGIKKVALTLEIETKELRGDNRRLDSSSLLVGCSLAFGKAKLNLDASAVIAGGTVVDSGVAPAQKATWSRAAADVMGQWKFEARTPGNGTDVVGGDGHLVVYKLTGTAHPLGLAEEDYQLYDVEASGAYLDSTGKLFDLVLNETSAVIA
jgi:hypothetical protein